MGSCRENTKDFELLSEHGSVRDVNSKQYVLSKKCVVSTK